MKRPKIKTLNKREIRKEKKKKEKNEKDSHYKKIISYQTIISHSSNIFVILKTWICLEIS